MRKIIGIILSLVLLFTIYAPSLSFAAETENKVGWIKENENWYYYEKGGSKRTGKIILDGVEYTLANDGSLLYGLKKNGNELIHYDEPGKLQNGWRFSATAWSYLKDGKYVTGPFTYKEKKFEINKYGEMEKGWITLRSNIKRMYPKPETKFLFESKAVKEGDVLEVIGKQGLWYQVKYQGETGYVRIFESVVLGENPVSSWDVAKEAANLSHFTMIEYHKDPEKYFPPNVLKKFEKQLDSDVNALANGYNLIDQIKATILLDNKQGWVKEDGKWTYYQKNGQRATDFQLIDGKRYYFGTDGFMQTGWIQKGSQKLYFSPSGVMQTGVQYIDGKMYYFNEFGWLTNGLHTIEGKPYYFDDSHEKKSGWMKHEYDWYLLHPSGALQTGDFAYKDKSFSFNQDGQMVKGWVILESLVKKVYPEPDLKSVLRAKRVKDGEIIEVTGKVGSWYEVKYQGKKGYVRIHDSIIFDQEAKSPLTLLDGKLKIFQGVFDYLKNDETLVNDTFKILEKAEQNALDDVELWENISKDVEQQKIAVKEQIRIIKDARDKLQKMVDSIKGDIKNLTVTQRNELRKLIGQDAVNITNDMLECHNFLLQSTVAYYENLSVLQDKTNQFLKDMSDAIVEIGENNRKLHEMFKETGALQDLGKVAESSIRLKKSVEVAKPKMEELARKTQETVPVIAGHLQTLQEKVPGFYTDVNTGLDFANAFMDSANKIASHKVDIPAAARNIGNIDLSNSLRDFGVSPEKINEYIAEQNKTNTIMNTTLDIMPILNVPKEAIQMYQGKEMGTERKYDPSDYAMGVLSVATGGTVKTLGKVVGTVADLEKKAKNLEKATQGTSGIGWSMPRGGGVINGRKYSEHALERMAPDTVEIRAELNTRAREMAAKKGYKPGTAEYEALFAKIDPRGMTPNVVEDIIKNGSRSPGGKPGTWKYSREDGYVIINDKGDVVTVVPAKKK
ncbi:S-layer protein [Bacillus pseudomycoides]|uniref:S-layer protein n=1 Tax=Bacillus pseudomycoides TaxID=64104 RepID=UPI000BF1E15E|nr:S-layer protein [Bacillus pseudomycoides]PEO48323.1 S-layer protein [Bacillus pseudomycoides]PGF05665.1 S-layer protein [Bacillus pseudomycoides]